MKKKIAAVSSRVKRKGAGKAREGTGSAGRGPGSLKVNCAFTKMVDPEKLVPHPRNSNQHTQAQIAILAELIRYHGWRRAITVSTRSGYIVRGHGEHLAGKKLMAKLVPVDYQDYASEKDEIADLMADNQIAGMSNLDYTMTADNISFLDDGAFPLMTTGFTPKEIESMLSYTPGNDREEKHPIPEAKADPRSKLGRVYQLGTHRIMCGDSGNQKHVSKLMAGELAQVVFTDPPYGVSYKAQSGKQMIQGDSLTGEKLIRMLTKSFKAMAEITKDNAAFYIWHASSTREEFLWAMKAAGLQEIQYLIWAKDYIGLGYTHYRWIHEPCFYASKEGNTPAFYGDKSDGTVWWIGRGAPGGELSVIVGSGILIDDAMGGKLYISQRLPKGKKVRKMLISEDQKIVLSGDDTGGTLWQVGRDAAASYLHPNQKPVELASRAIGNSSIPGDVVMDGFAGSGSTIIAAEKLSRRCYAMEHDPAYVDVCVERWCNFVGKDKEEIYAADE